MKAKEGCFMDQMYIVMMRNVLLASKKFASSHSTYFIKNSYSCTGILFRSILRQWQKNVDQVESCSVGNLQFLVGIAS